MILLFKAKVLGGIDRSSDVKEIIEILEQVGDDSIRNKIRNIQLSMFQEELSTASIMKLPMSQRNEYFKNVQDLKIGNAKVDTKQR